MANATITVLEADGVTQTDAIVLDVGRQAAAASKSVAASTEDKAVLDAIAASLALLDNSISAGNELQVDVVGALPAGTNNIGDVDVLTINGVAPVYNAGNVGATTLRVTLATDDAVGAAIVSAVNTAGASGVDGTVAHDSADSGNPVKGGGKAIAHGTNPTAVAAADRTDWYFNRAGVPFVIAGHPNVITKSATIDDADGAQTDASLLTVAGGSKIVITSISATCSSSNSGSVAVRIGFGAASVPAASEAGTAAVLLEGKFAAGGGHQRGNGSGILGVGADGEDLRITCDDPAGGSLFVTFSYYTIES
jgi:hypothetical protein